MTTSIQRQQKMATSSYIFDATDANFETAVIEKSRQVPVVVDFWAPWCGPCRALAPLLERLVNARKGDVLLARVNVDENPELAGYFGIEGIPAVKAIRNAEIVLQFEGLLPEEALVDFFDRLTPSEADKQAKATAALETTKPAEAESTYRQIIEKHPDHIPARLGLARLRLAAGDFDSIDKLLEPIPPGGSDGVEADRIRSERDLRRQPATAIDEAELRRKIETDPENASLRLELGRALAARKQFPEALAALLAAAERDRGLARGPVKETMVQVFHAIGVRSDLSEEYRDKLQRMMY
jgi:putative thioredoxin